MAKKKDDAGRSRKQRRRAAEDAEIVDQAPAWDDQWIAQMARAAMAQQDEAYEPAQASCAANELVLQAYQQQDREDRIQLARRAFEVYPGCAAALVCLAEVAPTSRDAELLYRMGVEVGESVLGGASGLAEYEGDFWSDPDAQSYLRARFGLARILWANGERDEAIRECCELLRLNPLDQLGVRYPLCSYYSETDQNDRWEQLLDQYADEPAADWSFSRALLAFRRQGDTPDTCELLQTAHAANSHVALFLLGKRTMPSQMPDYVDFGDESEAVVYVSESLSSWRATPGALAWVRRTLRIAPPEAEPARRPSMPRLLAAVAELPQAEGVIWQVDVRRPQIGCPDDWEGPPPWALIVTCPDTNELLILETLDDDQPAAQEVLIRLLETMQTPGDSEMERPEVIQVRRKSLAGNWRSKLNKLGIECQLLEELDHVEYVLESLQHMARVSGHPISSLEDHIDEIADLSVEPGEVWQADVRRLATWVTEEGMPRRPCGALVASCAENSILAQRVGLDEPSPDILLSAIATAILAPTVGVPHLPGRIEVKSDEVCRALQLQLEPLGVECHVVPELEHLDFVYSELERGLAAPGEIAALIDTPGVTLAHVAGFFDAAAEFYRRQPWRYASSDQAIRIDCDRFSAKTWYVVVMGQSGITLGLALYEDLELLKSILRQDDQVERRQAGISVMFGEAFEVSVRDLNAAEKHAWPIACAEAYPLILRINPGMAVRPPLNWELELTEACLRAIPEFLTGQKSKTTQLTVPTATGELHLSLAWQH